MKLNKMNDVSLEEIANMLKGLSEKSRLKIMQCLHKKEKTVTQLIQDTKLQQANLSKHLQILSKAGLVKSRRDGNKIIYSIANPSIDKICESICEGYAKHIKEKFKNLR